jgi:hypothetical protein
MSPARRVLLASFLFAAVLLPAPQALAQCVPAACAGTPVYLDFEGLAPGTAVEGLGVLHPYLEITSVAWPFGPTCPPGSAASIEEGVAVPVSYGTAGAFPNGCLGGIRGYGDDSGCVLDYDFTFAPGVTVSCFSFRMVDYGDLYPYGTAAHQVDVVAYDAANNVVDTDQLLAFGAVDATAGDACGAGPNGDPGNKLFTVTGAGIVRVTLRFDASPDPNVGFDDLSFCAHVEATPAAPASWGRLKTIYR